LKERFTKELVLAVPDIDKKMRMEVDVLDFGLCDRESVINKV